MKKLILGIAMICMTFSVFAENRFALLIANSNYKNFSSLEGPIKEAHDLSPALKSLGFTVELLENGTREQMLDKLDSIKQIISGKGGVALFHYGGHGVQAQGKNFLIPVDADIPDEKKLSTRAVDMDEAMSSLDLCGSDTNIVILDACRNNPLPAGAGRSASRGLTVVGMKPKNSIIVYSAEAGTVAQDGLFTPTLTKLITQNGKSLNQILMQLRREVSQKSNNSQIPGEYNQLFDDVFLNGDLTTNVVQSNNQQNNSVISMGRLQTFSTNFNDGWEKNFIFFTGIKLTHTNNQTFIVGEMENGSSQKQYSIKRGSIASFTFKTQNFSSLNICISKMGFKEKGFKTIGINFSNSNMKPFDMFGTDPQWRFLPSKDYSYYTNITYQLITDIDNEGKLTYTIKSNDSILYTYVYPNIIEDEKWSFVITVNGGSILVYEYSEYN